MVALYFVLQPLLVADASGDTSDGAGVNGHVWTTEEIVSFVA